MLSRRELIPGAANGQSYSCLDQVGIGAGLPNFRRKGRRIVVGRRLGTTNRSAGDGDEGERDGGDDQEIDPGQGVRSEGSGGGPRLAFHDRLSMRCCY